MYDEEHIRKPNLDLGKVVWLEKVSGGRCIMFQLRSAERVEINQMEEERE